MIDMIEHAKGAVTAIQKDMTEPGDDWFPIMIGVDGDGLTKVVLLQEVFQDGIPQDVKHEVLRELVAGMGFREVVTINSVWMHVMNRDGSPKSSGESVMIMHVSVAAITTAQAGIIRHKDAPPTLEEWMELSYQVGDDERVARMDGGVPKALYEGITA